MMVYMLYMFLDESGDLGFNLNRKGTSRYFLVTIITTKDKDHLNRIVKKTIRGLSDKNRKKHSGVLHAYKESPRTRKKLLDFLFENETLRVGLIYMDKVSMSKVSKYKKHILYNQMIEVLFGCVYKNIKVVTGENINLIVSKRETNKLLNKNFNLYIERNILNSHGVNLIIDIENTSSEKGLQVVDMVSWAIFRKYEYGDTSYYDLIKERIVEEFLFLE